MVFPNFRFCGNQEIKEDLLIPALFWQNGPTTQRHMQEYILLLPDLGFYHNQN